MKTESIEEVRAFNREYTVFMGLLNKSFLRSKYTLVETRVIHAILGKADITPSEIVSLLKIDKSYLSRIIKSLVRRKILKRARSKVDGRSIQLTVTAFGKKEFEKLTQASNAQVADLLSTLNEQQRNRLVKNMVEIRSILENR